MAYLRPRIASVSTAYVGKYVCMYILTSTHHHHVEMQRSSIASDYHLTAPIQFYWRFLAGSGEDDDAGMYGDSVV